MVENEHAEQHADAATGPSCLVCGKTDFKTVDGVISLTGPGADGYCHACDTQFFTLVPAPAAPEAPVVPATPAVPAVPAPPTGA